MSFEQLGLIGCGLIGGSFALAARRAGLARRIVGYSPTPASVQTALAMKAIDVAARSPEEAVAGSDLVLVAVPVAATESVFAAIAPALRADALLMDAGSTKRNIISAAERSLGARLGNFVPAHPIAGKENAGIEHADATLYAGRQVILTPLPQTQVARITQASKLWQALGSEVLTMSATEHDTAYAAVSHLPHLLAFALMKAISESANGAEWLELAGTGFRDFTRIAASSPPVWRDILLANRDQVLAQAQQFRLALQALEDLMRAGDADALAAQIQQVSAARAAMKF